MELILIEEDVKASTLQCPGTAPKQLASLWRRVSNVSAGPAIRAGCRRRIGCVSRTGRVESDSAQGAWF